MNESYHISRVFDHFINSQTNYSLFDTCSLLKLRKIGRKLETVTLSPYFNTRTLCFYTQRSVFQYVSASRSRNVYLAFLLKIDPCRKNDISSYIWPRSFVQTVKCSLLDEKIFYQSFYGAPLTFSCFFLLQGKVLCFDTRRQDLRDNFLLQRPCLKNYISGYIWHKSFIQTVKCSIFNQNCFSKFLWRAAQFYFAESSMFWQLHRQVCDLRDVYF